MRVRKALLGLAVPVVLLVAACGSNGASSTSTSAAAPAASTGPARPASAGGAGLTTKTIAGLGVVLVDARGHTLYAFAPDHARKVTCVGGCAAVWPPFASPGVGKPSTGDQVNAALVASDADPAGGRVVTYAGWPLYAYAGDPGAGTANGQGLNANGGRWWVISPAGKVITHSSGAGSAATATTQGGGAYGY